MGRKSRGRGKSPDWRGRTTGIPNGDERRRYVQQLGDQLRGTAPDIRVAPRGRVMFRSSTDEPWRDLGIIDGSIEIRPANPTIDWIEVRSADGTIVRQVPDLPMPLSPRFITDEVLRPPEPMTLRDFEASLRQMREAANRMTEMMLNLPPIQVQRGGIQYERGGGWASPHPVEWGDEATQWDISAYRKHDPRQGMEVYVYDLLPGARVYVLEDVFTVDRVDMHTPLPTVWLKELPTSPLYFTEDEYIYLANETED